MQKNKTGEARYTVTTPSLEVLDEWWRLVQEKGDPIERISPDLYVYDWDKMYPYDTLNDDGAAAKLKDRVLFTHWDSVEGNYHIQHMFPNQPAPNHITGKTYDTHSCLNVCLPSLTGTSRFYIRSKSDPTVFWVHDPNGVIVASKGRRTKFQIHRKDTKEDGAVIIPKDQITITSVQNSQQVATDRETGQLVVNKAGDTYAFSDLRGHPFGVGDKQGTTIDLNGSFRCYNIGENVPIMKVDGGGDEWELVA
jgi:hypothetical protein